MARSAEAAASAAAAGILLGDYTVLQPQQPRIPMAPLPMSQCAYCGIRWAALLTLITFCSCSCKNV